MIGSFQSRWVHKNPLLLKEMPAFPCLGFAWRCVFTHEPQCNYGVASLNAALTSFPSCDTDKIIFGHFQRRFQGRSGRIVSVQTCWAPENPLFQREMLFLIALLSILSAERWEFEPCLGKSNFPADRDLRNQKLSVGIGSYIFKFVAMLRHKN